MAKTIGGVALVATALVFASLLSFVNCHDHDHLLVKGKVYCDTCRVQFVTRITEYMSGAKVRLECRDRAAGEVKYAVDGETDATGEYTLTVKGDHEEEICEVKVIKSSRACCSEKMEGIAGARILLTGKNGIGSEARFANPLGFMKDKADHKCPHVLKELGFFPLF